MKATIKVYTSAIFTNPFGIVITVNLPFHDFHCVTNEGKTMYLFIPLCFVALLYIFYALQQFLDFLVEREFLQVFCFCVYRAYSNFLKHILINFNIHWKIFFSKFWLTDGFSVFNIYLNVFFQFRHIHFIFTLDM